MVMKHLFPFSINRTTARITLYIFISSEFYLGFITIDMVESLTHYDQ